MRHLSSKKQKKIAVIGAGWNGVHIALSFAKRGDLVTLFEAGSKIFSGVSGNFGIRIHAGPHYPRSYATRKACYSGFHEFRATYPDLVNSHEYSIYAFAKYDVDGQPSKVSESEFRATCQGFQFTGEVDVESLGYNDEAIAAAFDLEEPSAVLGPRLRHYFEKKLKEHKITVRCDFPVDHIKKEKDITWVGRQDNVAAFDYVINTTSFQSLLPDKIPLPFDMKVAYQICLALEYKDRTPSEKPFSFIVMDGWFPCFMPYDDRPISDTGPVSKYIMTHGKWTIVGSYDTPEEAHSSFRKLDDDFIDKHVKQPTEKHMRQFWADFSKRFEYVGWSGAVLAKVKTDSEFRGTFVFQEPITDMICVFPGKITGIFDADRETLNLISGQSVLTTLEGYRYIRDGVLYTAGPEINADRKFDGRSTCELQTHRDLLDNKLDRGEIAISVRKRTGSIGSLVGLEEEVSCLSSKDMIMLCLGFGGVSVGGYCFGVEYAAPALGVWVLLWLCSKAPCIPASNIEFVERIRALGIFYRPGNWLGLDSPQFGGQNTETPLLKA